MIRFNFVVVLLLAVIGSVSGCQESKPVSVRTSDTADASDQQDHLKLATDYLASLNEHGRGQSTHQVLYHLNEWIAGFDVPEGWQPDPMYAQLTDDLKVAGFDSNLTRRSFNYTDLGYLEVQRWLKKISIWAQDCPRSKEWDTWLKENRERLGSVNADELGDAQQLFDWTIRHIQLNEMLASPQKKTVGPSASGNVQQQNAPWKSAIPGPGYSQSLRTTLLFGKADAWQRSDLFIQLAAQQGIDVVMLGIQPKNKSETPVPWLTAALIGEQLYLFDAELGLALQSEDGGILTLSQLRESPELLKQLALDSETPYRVSADDLDRVVALISTSLYGLSQRMQLLDSLLPNERQIGLASFPSDLKERLASCDQLQGIRLWDMPWQALIFDQSIGAAMQRPTPENREFLRNLSFQMAPFQTGNPVRKAREAQLLGQLESIDQDLGAKEMYRNAMNSERVRNAVLESADLQRQIGMVFNEDRETRESYERRLALAIEIRLHASQQHSTYWLGLAHYDSGKTDVAAKWLQKRVVEKESERWIHGGVYNLARCLEHQGKLQEAREVLLRDESPQRHGNILRARRLKRRMQAASSVE